MKKKRGNSAFALQKLPKMLKKQKTCVLHGNRLSDLRGVAIVSASKYSVSAVTAAVSAALGPGVTAAQQAGDDDDQYALEEIIVTATKRTQSVQDIPATVQAITQESLAAMGAAGAATAAERRVELIKQTQTLGSQMAGTGDRDGQSILKLIDALQQLQRPLEALGWRGVLVAYADAAASISEPQAQQVLDEIVRERTALLSGNQARATEEFVLCGVNLEAIPSREDVVRQLRASAGDER